MSFEDSRYTRGPGEDNIYPVDFEFSEYKSRKKRHAHSRISALELPDASSIEHINEFSSNHKFNLEIDSRLDVPYKHRANGHVNKVFEPPRRKKTPDKMIADGLGFMDKRRSKRAYKYREPYN